MKKPAAGEEGFMMVEALAALAVAAIAGAGIVAALSSASERSAEVRVRDLALRQAEALIVEAVDQKEGGQLAGQGSGVDSSLLWTRTIGPLGEDYPTLERIDVVVSWRASRRTGETRLEAYRIAPQP